MRRFHGERRRRRSPRAEALQIARARGRQPGRADRAARRARTTAAGDARAARAARCATSSSARKRRAGGHDLRRPAHAPATTTLAGPRRRRGRRARLRERYRVVLVDEFQDTDPVQWDILRRAFGDGGVDARPDRRPEAGDLRLPRRRRLRLPRGRARRAGDARDAATSTGAATRACSTPTTRCSAARSSATRGSSTGTVRARRRGRAPRRAARSPRRCGSASSTATTVGTDAPRATRSAPPAREHIAARPRRRPRRGCSSLGRDGRRRPAPVAPGARRRARAHATATPRWSATRSSASASRGDQRRRQRVRDRARRASGCGCSRRSSGPASTAARARGGADAVPRLDAPSRSPPPTTSAWEEVHRRLHDWARVLRARGVASLTETITLVEGLPERVLARRRRRAAADRPAPRRPAPARARRSTEQLGTAALTVVAARSGSPTPSSDTGDEERSRRLESDAEAVQVLTIHRSKGLEFPIVYCPYLWEPTLDRTTKPSRSSSTTRTRGDERDDRRRPRGRRTSRATSSQHVAEQRGEDLRLAYVALTRAQHQAVVWWAGVVGQPRLGARPAAVRARRRRRRAADAAARAADDARRRARFEELAAQAPGLHQRRARRDPGRRVALARRRAARRRELVGGALRPRARPALAPHLVQRHHRRRARGARGERARGARVVDDEPTPRAAAGRGGRRRRGALRAVPSLLGDDAGRRRRSARSCTASSRRPTSPRADLDAELRARRSRAALARRPVDIGDRRRVVAGLRAAIETPLGPLVGGVAAARRRARRPARRARLRAAARRRRRADRAARRSGAIGARPARAPRRRRPARAATPTGSTTRRCAPSVRGYLTGSIDLVVRRRRARSPSSTTRRTGSRAPGEALTAWHYRPGGARRRDGARALRRCRRCSTPSRCTATCAGGCRATTPSATSPASSTCSCAG